jgi:hypothetical protein
VHIRQDGAFGHRPTKPIKPLVNERWTWAFGMVNLATEAQH